jgi:hypothetical protein
MGFARWVFRIAGIYGLLVLLPLYFMEAMIGRDNPPPITHPEYYYGFIGVAVAWQVVFLVIGQDPIRYRALMIVSVLEKFPFGIAAIILFAQNRIAEQVLAGGLIDLVLGALFVAAWWRTAPGTTKETS